MSIYSIMILLIIFLCFIFYLFLKQRKIKKLNILVQNKQSEEIRAFLTEKHTHYFISEYLVDLYTARSYTIDQNAVALKKTLNIMFEKNYQESQNNDYLTLYFHYFINRSDFDFAKEILERIKKEHDQSFYKYCNWTYEVLAENQTSYTAEMETAIENKEYHSFPLGVICYLIAVQMERLQDSKNASLWYDTALTVLQKKDFYYRLSAEKAEAYHKSME